MDVRYSYELALEFHIIYIVSLLIGTWMPYYFYHNYPNWYFIAIFYWEFTELIIWGGIPVEKPNNQLWGVFSYFRTRVPTPNEKPFLPFLILNPYFCSYFSFLTFCFIVVLFLFVYFHFWRCYEAWVQFIFVSWVLKDIGLLLYIYFVPI